MSVEQEMTLPTTPWVIMLGSSLLFATHWMVSIEGKVFYEVNQIHNFDSAFAAFFGSFYVFNLEYLESASTTLEMVQRLMQCKICRFEHPAQEVLLKHDQLCHYQGRYCQLPCLYTDCICSFKTTG